MRFFALQAQNSGQAGRTEKNDKAQAPRRAGSRGAAASPPYSFAHRARRRRRGSTRAASGAAGARTTAAGAGRAARPAVAGTGRATSAGCSRRRARSGRARDRAWNRATCRGGGRALSSVAARALAHANSAGHWPARTLFSRIARRRCCAVCRFLHYRRWRWARAGSRGVKRDSAGAEQLSARCLFANRRCGTVRKRARAGAAQRAGARAILRPNIHRQGLLRGPRSGPPLSGRHCICRSGPCSCVGRVRACVWGPCAPCLQFLHRRAAVRGSAARRPRLRLRAGARCRRRQRRQLSRGNAPASRPGAGVIGRAAPQALRVVRQMQNARACRPRGARERCRPCRRLQRG